MEINRRACRVGYFFYIKTTIKLKRPGFVPDRYLLKKRQSLSLRKQKKNGAIFQFCAGHRRNGD
ncbi:hypothetical protein F3H50_21020 [Escherichia coli]|nr:hypothetical protein [Escherichia coli]EFW0659894.1 hypothetical protein [Shigella dysenteriae]EFA7893259.1 hypothetical protein [Escherichia coli]EFB5147773.1 hypothetical protein [Escherichia coli]EFB9612614.1 hypothetical protein [Escherichia coli]